MSCCRSRSPSVTEFIKEHTEKIYDNDLAKQRQAICDQCEHRIEYLNQCHICFCFLSLKTGLPAAECPLGKWAIDNAA